MAVLPLSGNPIVRRLLSVPLVIAALWLWWQAATVATAYLLGENERFQLFVIELISNLRASGSLTLLLLGSCYAAASLLQLLFWPAAALQRRLGAPALVFWAVVTLSELTLHVVGMTPYEQAWIAPLTDSAALWFAFRLLAALVTALGPELLLMLALRLWLSARRPASPESSPTGAAHPG